MTSQRNEMRRSGIPAGMRGVFVLYRGVSLRSPPGYRLGYIRHPRSAWGGALEMDGIRGSSSDVGQSVSGGPRT